MSEIENQQPEDWDEPGPDGLLNLAKQARDAGRLELALALARRALTERPGDCGTAAVVSAVLRKLKRPREALAATEELAGSTYVPLLTSRAAALCDLERWTEALELIVRALAAADDPELAANVYMRIVVNKPELELTAGDL